MIFATHNLFSKAAARDFDPSGCSGQDAIDVVTSLGDAAQADRRDVGEGGEAGRGHRGLHLRLGSKRRGALRPSRGRRDREAKRAIEAASQLESLPATDAAVRSGTLSSRQAELIAGAAVDDPSVEGELLKVAAQGMPKLRERCVAVRAAREDQAERSKRQQAVRSFMMWTDADGMVEGHFGVTPEVGGAIKA